MKELNTIAEDSAFIPQNSEPDATATETQSAAEEITPAAEGVEEAKTTEESSEMAEESSENSEATVESSEALNDESGELSFEKSGDATETTTFTVPIRFNHERRDLSVEEAASYAQKGLAAEPVMSKLRYIAATQNKSVGQVVDGILSEYEQSRIDKIVKRVGGDMDLANELIAAQKQKDQKALGDMIAAQQIAQQQEAADENKRLADGFLQLQKEFPQISEIGKVPRSVISDAIDKNISLLDSYLRFLHSENRRIEEAKATQEAAARAAVGSQKSPDTRHISAEIEALIRGIWG